MSDNWQPIETAPEGGKIIAGYFNHGGKWRSFMARYYKAGTLESLNWFDESDESGYAPAGWYEESETHEELLPISPTHWQPLPAAPTSVEAA